MMDNKNTLAWIIVIVSFILLGLLIYQNIQLNQKISHNGVTITQRDYIAITEKIKEPVIICDMESGKCNIMLDTERWRGLE